MRFFFLAGPFCDRGAALTACTQRDDRPAASNSSPPAPRSPQNPADGARRITARSCTTCGTRVRSCRRHGGEHVQTDHIPRCRDTQNEF